MTYHRVGGPDVHAYFDVDEPRRAAHPAVDPPKPSRAKSAGPGQMAQVSASAWPLRRVFPTRARLTSRTTRSIREPAPCASEAYSPTRTKAALPRLFRPRPRSHRSSPPGPAGRWPRPDRAPTRAKVLYIVNQKHEVVSRPVRLGCGSTMACGRSAGGLKPGEQVIVSGLQQVRPGMTVEPKVLDMPVRLAANSRTAEKH